MLRKGKDGLIWLVMRIKPESLRKLLESVLSIDSGFNITIDKATCKVWLKDVKEGNFEPFDPAEEEAIEAENDENEDIKDS